jgi:hypothetical protein
MTPTVEPMTRTCASATAVPDEASVTRPVTVPVICAAAVAETASSNERDVIARRGASERWDVETTTCGDMRTASEWLARGEYGA